MILLEIKILNKQLIFNIYEISQIFTCGWVDAIPLTMVRHIAQFLMFLLL